MISGIANITRSAAGHEAKLHPPLSFFVLRHRDKRQLTSVLGLWPHGQTLCGDAIVNADVPCIGYSPNIVCSAARLAWEFLERL
jgi:hypothetical protein